MFSLKTFQTTQLILKLKNIKPIVWLIIHLNVKVKNYFNKKEKCLN